MSPAHFPNAPPLSTSSKMAVVDVKTVVLAGGAFLVGVVLGWNLHGWRIQRLRNKRDYYAEKAFAAHKQMEQ